MARTPLSLPFDGRRLRTLRERAGLSQSDLAELASEHGRKSVSRLQVVRAEGGTNKPTPWVLAALVKALDIEIDDLLTPAGENRQESA